jgi:hypothetical protein
MKRTDKSDGRRRLRLERETLRLLDTDELARVQGGIGGVIVIAAVPKITRCCTTGAN